jgi:hypothetical protein
MGLILIKDLLFSIGLFLIRDNVGDLINIHPEAIKNRFLEGYNK